MWKYLHHKLWGVLVGLPMVVMLFLSEDTRILGAEDVPTIITSETMTAHNKEHKVIFEGTVVLTQGDLVVHSDVMSVLFKENAMSQSGDSGSSGRKIEMIDARGKVVIKKANGRATCGHAVYYKAEEKIVLTDSPVAWQRGTRVSGPKMTMYLKEDRSVVEGGSQVMFLDAGDGG